MDTQTTDDILGTVPESNGGEWQLLEAGLYEATLKELYVAAKSPQAMDREAAKYPDKEIEPDEFVWIFELQDAEYVGQTMRRKTSKSLNPKSKAHAYAAALYGRALEPGETVKKSLLIGVECVLNISQYKGFDDNMHNGIEAVLPKRKRKPTAAPTIAQGGDLTQRLKAALATLNYPKGIQQAHYQEVVPENIPFKELTDEARKQVVEFFEAKVAQMEPDDLDF